MKTGGIAVLVFLVVACSVSIQGLPVGDYKWAYFVFSQWWPQSQCYYHHNQDMTDEWRPMSEDMVFRNNCVPADVSTWTLHGLWPTIGGKADPVNCNNSWPFFEEKIMDLEPKMMQRWLSLPEATKSSSLHLWSHEWNKHGTCGTNLAQINSEHKYFQQALYLNSQPYDMLSKLANENISPSDDHTYSVKDVEDAIAKAFGAKGRVVCLRGPDGQQLLGGIRICLNKSFEPLDCIQTEAEKCYDDDLSYPTIIR